MDLLTSLTEHCARLLDVASAGLLLANPGRHLHLMAATSEQTRDLEVFQLQADQGPCLDCYATGQPVSVCDVRTETQRWPRFVAAATDAGFASVHAVPMRAAGIVLGALGLFGTRPGELNEADLLVGQTLAHIACVAILQEHPPTPSTVIPQLRSALTHRVVERLWADYGDALIMDGASSWQAIATLLAAGRAALVTVFLSAFGRAIAEVGAILIVGGNIAGYTRTMTTAITLETSEGNFAFALALGFVLISISIAVSGCAFAIAAWSRRTPAREVA